MHRKNLKHRFKATPQNLALWYEESMREGRSGIDLDFRGNYYFCKFLAFIAYLFVFYNIQIPIIIFFVFSNYLPFPFKILQTLKKQNKKKKIIKEATMRTILAQM